MGIIGAANRYRIRAFMRVSASISRLLYGVFPACLVWVAPSSPGQGNAKANSPLGVLLSVQGDRAEVLRQGATVWQRADPTPPLNGLFPGDQLRTGPNSRVAVRWSDHTVTAIAPQSHLDLAPGPRFNLLKGIMYFFHRGKPGKFNLQTPTASTAVLGTEFNLAVADNLTTTLTMFDGEVEMSNPQGRLRLGSGEEGFAAPGQSPEKTARLFTVNIVQWALYYPGVLDPAELSLSRETETALAQSLAAYRKGDLLAALISYPPNRQPTSNDETIYRAALLLAVGEVEQAAKSLKELNVGLAVALRRLIAAVKLQDFPASVNSATSTSSEWLAESYYQQARFNLEKARVAAQRAVGKSPDFAFGWSRLAEMEFSFGRNDRAREAVGKSLRLAPRNAEAVALEGFLFAAKNEIPEAIQHFDQAIAIDSALGNAWLGRGLCRIRQGDAEAGLQDLQMAATLEPQRAPFRSYLGKAFNLTGDTTHALKELELARQLDRNDPTAWLYSALIKQQQSRINEAVRDLEESQRLNDNRRVYRSRLLLDQDRAVREANLASIYQDAGMSDLSAREAVRAVNADYANYSAHLFLAESYGAFRDPHLVDLRYETPSVNEYLLANLLADPRSGTLSPYVTEQEYSKLFEGDHFGFASSTTWLSRGDWLQTAAQYGIFDNASYAVEQRYSSFNGQRPNNELEQSLTSVKWKQHLTPRDSVYLEGIYSDATYGDLRQLYNPDASNTEIRFHETQEPLVLAGYHHEWGPGSHTLFLGGRLEDTLRASPRGTNANSDVLALFKDSGQVVGLPAAQSASGDILFPFFPSATLNYRSEFEAYTAELQHIWQSERHTVVAGGRFQSGTFDTAATVSDFAISGIGGNFGGVPTTNFFGSSLGASGATNDFVSRLERWSVYGYYQFKILAPLQVTAGLSYDWLDYPKDFRDSPLSNGQRKTDRFSPKSGLIWTPSRFTTLRAAYTRGLGGVSFDQSFRLEPSQVGGFNQSFRSLIPESVVGALAAPRFETWGLAFDQKFDTGTYLGIEADLLHSKADRDIGVFDLNNFPPQSTPSVTRENLNYYERNLLVSVNQLVANNLSLGARYRLSDSNLKRQLPSISPAVTQTAATDVSATLHQLSLFSLFNHPSGWFSSFESAWWAQGNRHYEPALAGDDFWQFNAFVGYRFPRRRAELSLGLLNLTDRDYRLNPLNLTAELPRGRTLVTSFRFNF